MKSKKGRGKTRNIFFNATSICHLFCGVRIKLFGTKKLNVSGYVLIQLLFAFWLEHPFYCSCLKLLSSIIQKKIIFPYYCTVICLLISSGICILLWSMLSKWKYLPFRFNETKCAAGIKLRCQPSWKWNIPDNEISPYEII